MTYAHHMIAYTAWLITDPMNGSNSQKRAINCYNYIFIQQDGLGFGLKGLTDR